MEAFSKGRYNFSEQTEEQRKARLRMALFPKGQEYLFVQEDMWVPVVRVAGKVSFFFCSFAVCLSPPHHLNPLVSF